LPTELEQPVVIRPSRDTDVDAMLAIYRRHIRQGVEEGVSDADTPQPDDLRDRRKNLRSKRFPHLVATQGGEVREPFAAQVLTPVSEIVRLRRVGVADAFLDALPDVPAIDRQHGIDVGVA